MQTNVLEEDAITEYKCAWRGCNNGIDALWTIAA